MENQGFFEERRSFDEVKENIEKIQTEIRKVIVGQDRMVQLLIASILAGGHVLIEGNPGLAKTLTAKLLSRCIDVDFSRIQFTPDLMPSDVLGTSIFNMKNSEFEFKKGPVFSQIVLIDEINRSPAKTQSALFEIMEERQVTIDGDRYVMKEPFLIIATQNPVDMEGTYRLPEAQMDRFLMKINVTYPTKEQEVEIIRNFHNNGSTNAIDDVKKVLSGEDVINMKKQVKSVYVEDNLINYIAQIVHRTRNHRDIYVGASPRASLAILMGAKAIAIMRGRDFVSPDDILYVAVPVLAHRILLTPEKEMEGATAEKVIDQLIKSEEIPR